MDKSKVKMEIHKARRSALGLGLEEEGESDPVFRKDSPFSVSCEPESVLLMSMVVASTAFFFLGRDHVPFTHTGADSLLDKLLYGSVILYWIV